jgi:hypothetical protein
MLSSSWNTLTYRIQRLPQVFLLEGRSRAKHADQTSFADTAQWAFTPYA